MSRQKRFLLKNLCCPTCAAAIEEKVAAMGGVSEASVDIISKKLTLSYDETLNPDTLSKDVEAAVKSVEPGISFEETKKAKAESSDDDDGKKELIRLIAGIAVFAGGAVSAFFGVPKPALIAIFAICLVISGGEVFINAAKNIFRGHIFDENLLMTIAAVGAFAIGQYEESAAVLVFYQIGEYLEDLATEKSKKSIADLMNLRPDYANLVTDKGTRRVSPEKVKIGDIIEIAPGERVPLDGTVIKGSSFVDTSGLTGEPVPREIGEGEPITGGFVNGSGLLRVRVQKEYGESTVAKIISLVENAGSKKAKAEHFITRFARIYTPAVTGAALLIALVPPLFFAQNFYTWLYRAVIFLVVSCPCALVVSVPLGFFAGIGAASKNGILVKGGNYLEKLSDVDTFVFDKTGTLTKGVFEVTGTECANGITPKMLIETAAISQTMSSHPIAKSIIKASGANFDRSKIKNFQELAGMGVIAQTDSGVIVCGNEKLMAHENITFRKCDDAGTLAYVAADGKYIGCITISDIIKDGAANAVKGVKTLGAKKTVMLTGDRQSAAQAVAGRLGIDEVRAELLPGQKVAEFEKVQKSAVCAAFVGDGINDAPVLARADIGIAMGGIGSDAAVEAADVVIMDDNPARIVTAMHISRHVKKIVRQNIVFALGVKFAVLVLGALGFVNIWAAVFADTGVTLIAVLNSLRLLFPRKNKNK